MIFNLGIAEKRARSFGVKWIWISDPRSLRSWCNKGTDESTLITDSSVPLMYHDPSARSTITDPHPDHRGTHSKLKIKHHRRSQYIFPNLSMPCLKLKSKYEPAKNDKIKKIGIETFLR